ncbi:putative rRNA methylase-domain-containing protein [Pelagophyceae sp. CCMP2097]|nr:putative rRNA methylase-domain-containing protein [Pelagophyceae sp. CCMP2097]
MLKQSVMLRNICRFRSGPALRARRFGGISAVQLPTQSHLQLARSLWLSHIKRGDVTIDATCGRGSDTQTLLHAARRCGGGTVYAMDVDARAVQLCSERIRSDEDANEEAVCTFHHQSHAFPPPGLKARSVRIVAYNLGYLPRSEGGTTTSARITIESLSAWTLDALLDGGLATICISPSHAAGRIESIFLSLFARQLSSVYWRCVQHRPLNHAETAPYLLSLHKLGVDDSGAGSDTKRRSDIDTRWDSDALQRRLLCAADVRAAADHAIAELDKLSIE